MGGEAIKLQARLCAIEFVICEEPPRLAVSALGQRPDWVRPCEVSTNTEQFLAMVPDPFQ